MIVPELQILLSCLAINAKKTSKRKPSTIIHRHHKCDVLNTLCTLPIMSHIQDLRSYYLIILIKSNILNPLNPILLQIYKPLLLIDLQHCPQCPYTGKDIKGLTLYNTIFPNSGEIMPECTTQPNVLPCDVN